MHSHPRCALLLALTVLTAPTARAAPVRLPDGSELRQVDFERHIVPLLGRMGCNTGACHGSFQGKGGLRLSLFGAAPEKDYLALTRGDNNRRIDLLDPDRSLLLLKPSAQLPHLGGERFRRDSWTYCVLRQWIAEGARWQPGSGTVRKMDVTPREQQFAGPGESAALRVTVEFADGSRADVTPFCGFRVQDESIVRVTPAGRMHALHAGDTVVIISYRGNLTNARVLVRRPVSGDFVYPAIPEENFIDRFVFSKLRRLNIVPSELAGDTEFLRRVTLDTLGTLPTPDDVRAFLADHRPDKRRRTIEALLTHPMHAALWATRFCDITGNNIDVMDGSPELRARRAKMWHDWLRERFVRNVPYSEIVRGILCATSRGGKDVDTWLRDEIADTDAAMQGAVTDYAHRPTLDLFWRRSTPNGDFFPLEQMAELTASAFLGIRIECAQCHKHPFDRWTQADYRSFANVFSQVNYGSSSELRSALARMLDERRRTGQGDKPVARPRELFVSNASLRRLTHPETNDTLPARALGGPEIPLHGDARRQLYEWLVRPDNPFFARNFVNRIWAHYFGAGLVEPVDNFSIANPPSHPELLDALAEDFTRSGFHIRRLELLILTSRTYQLSSRANETNATDTRNLPHARVRRLMAEVVVDALNAALGTVEDFGADAPPGARAIEIAPNRVRRANLARIFRLFGRPERAALCDCERPTEPALPQTLFLMTDAELLKKIENGRLKMLLDSGRTEEEILDELFLATLSRFPGAAEKRSAREHLQGKKDRRAGYVDVVWALVNTREFILNH